MRKSSVTIMAILMVCFGTMLVAANVLSKPLQEDASVAIEMTRLLGHQGLIAKDSKVFVTRRSANEHTLAKKGRGALVELSPSSTILDKRNGLHSMARRLVREVRTNFAEYRLDWIEVRFLTEEMGRVRSLVERDRNGRYQETYKLAQDTPASSAPKTPARVPPAKQAPSKGEPTKKAPTKVAPMKVEATKAAPVEAPPTEAMSK